LPASPIVIDKAQQVSISVAHQRKACFLSVSINPLPHKPPLHTQTKMSSKKKGSMSDNLHEKKTRVGFTNPAPVYVRYPPPPLFFSCRRSLHRL
jgi:hypothetical protein